jgi:hypothetical protein
MQRQTASNTKKNTWNLELPRMEYGALQLLADTAFHMNGITKPADQIYNT